MSLIYPNRYPGRWDPTSAQYPQGKFKNRSSPTAKDGSFCEMDWANDWAGFFGAILKNAGVTPNGSVDTATVSQLYSALIGGIVKTAGLRDVGTGANQIPDMSAYSNSATESMLNGWRKTPDGYIEQWVSTDIIGSPTVQNINLNFPIPFPKEILSFGVPVISTDDPTQRFASVNYLQTTNSKIALRILSATANKVFVRVTGR